MTTVLVPDAGRERDRSRDTAEVLGCHIDRIDMERTLDRCVTAIESRTFTQHMEINAAKLVALQSDAELRAIVDSCTLVTADGQAVVWASRLLGDPLPERVAGVDLMHRLLALAEERGYRVYFFGARQAVLEGAMKRLRQKHPRLSIAGYRNGYFAPEDQAEIAREIRDARPDMLFVAISSPTKEYFLGTYGREIGVPFVMGVGGAIDIVAGVRRRAPHQWQRLGLEWLYRMLQEPRRMFKRYAVTNTGLTWMVGRELVRPRRRQRRPTKRER
jgi:N-acetylglucosaminyldiphosphoundecaprenol N-acetyl-beta-D-mannosaminyltransferase